MVYILRVVSKLKDFSGLQAVMLKKLLCLGNDTWWRRCYYGSL